MNIVALIILAALAYGLWWLVVIGPAHFDNLDIKEAVSAGLNQIRNMRPDEAVVAGIIEAGRKTGEHKEDDGYGTIVWKPGLGLTPENVTITRDEVHNQATIRVEYIRVRVLKPTEKERQIRLVVEETGPLSQ